MKSPLIIRDGFAQLNGDKTTHEMPSGELTIVGEDDRSLFNLRIQDGELVVNAMRAVRINGKIFTDAILVKPISRNVANICRIPEA